MKGEREREKQTERERKKGACPRANRNCCRFCSRLFQFPNFVDKMLCLFLRSLLSLRDVPLLDFEHSLGEFACSYKLSKL